MSSELRPFHVVVVSQDLALLHEISWTLEAVGYKVQTTSDFSQDALWRRYSFPDFLIVDGRNISWPTADSFAHDSENSLYRILLYDPAKQTDFSAWFAAGAQDALRTPISRGELLARVRTGARYLEFERRLQIQSSRCRVPGMYSRRGFLRKLRKLQVDNDFGSSQHVLLLTAIDCYTGICRRSGETASLSLANSAARAIKRAAGESAVSGYFGDGRFATLLAGQSLTEAKAVAESIAKDFVGRESHPASIPRPALTGAVVPWTVGSNADRVVSDALQTLELAEHSGGGCILLHGDFDREFAAWKAEMSTGNPFDNVVAQDIMAPFAAILSARSQQNELAEALRRSGIPVRLYVDGDGRLVGVADDEHAVAKPQSGHAGSLAGETLAMPETISCDASFPEIYEAFSSRGCATLVVMAGDQPLGYITCDGFLSMIDPIHTESFARTVNSADELAYLIVPSTISEAVAESAAV